MQRVINVTKAEFLAELKASRNKYGNRKTIYNGTTFDSKKEAGRATDLDLLFKAGAIGAYARQVRIPLIVNGTLVATYVADFCIYDSKGIWTQVIETKGFQTRDSKLKMKLFQALYPNITLTIDK